MKTYTCNKCKQTLSCSSFHKNASSITGYYSLCKNCKALARSVIREMLSNTKKRALKRGLSFNLTLTDIEKLNTKQEGKCAISSIILNWEISTEHHKQRICPPDRASIDRIDSNKGYTTDNIQLVTDVANRIKSWLSMEELIAFCNAVVSNHTK